MLDNFVSYDVLQMLQVVVFSLLLTVRSWQMTAFILGVAAICNSSIASVLTELVENKSITWEFYAVWALFDAVICGLLLSDRNDNHKGIRLQTYVLAISSLLHIIMVGVYFSTDFGPVREILKTCYSNGVWILTATQIMIGVHVIPSAIGAIGRFLSDLSRQGGRRHISCRICSNLEKYIQTHKKIPS